ncbi:MAG: M1 family aminopeptidase [Bacteroidetes bacterium]|nr:M1 family aminopeptidase [Bacteroidota bacterium]
MKKKTKSLLFAAISVAFLFINGLHAQEEAHYHRFPQWHAGTTPPSATARPESSGNSGTGGNMDVLYHKIYWRINPDTTVKYIKGYVQTNFKTIQPNVSQISFDMRAVLTLDSILFRGARIPTPNIVRTGNIVTVNLGATLANNFIDSFTVFYQGVPPNVVGAAQGYQRSNNTGAGNYITTLSESYEDRDWWPCKADMQDKIDSMDVTVNVPWGAPTAADTFWVAFNGKLVDSTITGTNRDFVFKTRYPIASYLVFVSVARFNRYYRSLNVSGTEVPVAYNLFRGKTAAQYNTILTAMDRINPVVVGFSNKFGDYPFKNEKHGFYDGLLGAGGMEHQTMSGIATSSLSGLRLLTHELNHQWFGDNVTFATWNDLWLAEGFASYSEALVGELEPTFGINPTTVRQSYKNAALASTVSAWIPDGNIGNSDLIWNSGYGGAVYDRGAMIVSMLRAMCGDTKFFQALTNYQTVLKGKSANTDMLKGFFNTELGTDITPFFNDYVGGSGNAAVAVGGRGFPTNTVNWNSPVPNKLVIQAAAQTQSAISNVTYFRGPVVVHAKGAVAGQDTMITYFDWGGGNLSVAGNGIGAPVAGGKLSFILSFTPTSLVYDEGARTMSNGTTVLVPGLNDGGFNFNSIAASTAACPAPATMTASLTTTSNSGFANPITLSATAGVPAGTTVTFSTNPVTPGSGSTIQLNNANTLASGTYTITIQGTATGATTQTTTVSFTITPGAGPAINTQPAGQTVCSGSNAVFTLSAPAAASYQWQVSTNGGGTFTNIPGANATTFTLTAVTTALNNNQYRCIATALCGNTTSGAAILTVNAAPAIGAQPAAATICTGGTNTFCVTATGTGLSYQWEYATNCTTAPWQTISNAAPFSGANTACLTITNAPITFANYAFRCVINSTACSNSVTSNCATLTLINPATITTAPADAAICAGSNHTFTVAGNSTEPIAYQWQVSTDGGTNWTAIGGATNATYTVSNASATLNGNRYRCLLSNATCTTPVISNAGILTVRPLPTVGLTAAPLTSLLPGKTTTLTATPGASAGGTITSSWLYNANPLAVTGNTYVVSVDKAGAYQVRIQEAWAGGLICSNLSPVVTITAEASSKLFIFPSPNNGLYAVSYYNSATATTKREVVVFDMKGAMVYRKRFDVIGAYTLMQIDMSRANAGTYIVVVGDAEGKKLAEGKVVVQ